MFAKNLKYLRQKYNMEQYLKSLQIRAEIENIELD